MPSPIDHPLFGRMVPDQWNQDLLTFREFPHMRPFWVADRDRTLAGLASPHRQWVENWQEHVDELSQVCRNGDVHAGLQSLGVYELSLEVPKGTGEPSEPQAAAYRYFNENEQRICENVVDALLRYYRVAREELPDWFEDGDYPDNPTAEQLGRLLAFDGFCIRRCSADGMSPLRLAWDPDWDPEHGLVMAVFRDRVLAIGTDDVEDFLCGPDEASLYGIWGPKHMTESERSTLHEFIDRFETTAEPPREKPWWRFW